MQSTWLSRCVMGVTLWSAVAVAQSWEERSDRRLVASVFPHAGANGQTIMLRVPGKIDEWCVTGWRNVGSLSTNFTGFTAAAYDSTRGHSVAETFNLNGRQTLVYDPKDWSLLAMLPGCGASTLVDDPGRGVLALTQDHQRQATQDYRWTGTGWSALPPNLRPYQLLLMVTADLARGRLVGVVTGNGLPSLDTYEWDGISWRQIPTAVSPPVRDGGSIAFDPWNKAVVLFGGSSGATVLTDTWLWNGVSWRQLVTPTTPAVTPEARLMTDPVRERVVLLDTNLSSSQDYEFTGIDWRSITSGLPGGDDHQVATDLIRNVIVDYRDGVVHEYDGAMTTTIVAPGPSRRLSPMAYDLVTQLCVVFGGRLGTPFNVQTYGDTWLWDGATWNQSTVTNGPTARSSHALVSALTVGGLILFGGVDSSNAPLGDTWLWRGGAWSDLTPNLPLAPAAGRASGASGPLGVAPIVRSGTSVWQFATGWNQLAASIPQMSTPALMLSPTGIPVISGFAGSSMRSFELIGGTWVPLCEAPAYFDHSAYLPQRGNLVAYSRGKRYVLTTVPASTTRLGSGCGAPVPELVSREPVLGGAGLQLVASNTRGLAWFGADLNTAAVSLGGGCTGYLGAPVTLGFVASNTYGFASLPFALPANPAFWGMDLYCQVGTLQPGGPLGGVALSGGLHLRLGD